LSKDIFRKNRFQGGEESEVHSAPGLDQVARLGAVPSGGYGRGVRELPVYVESDVSMADDHVTAAWVFEADVWGRCGQGRDEAEALAALRAELDEQALGAGFWTTTKVLRRLAWHERSELRVLHHLAAHAADTLRTNS
jgi:hypothetical protein